MKKYLKLRYVILLMTVVGPYLALHHSPQPMNEVYQVQSGDTLWSIASEYNGGNDNTEQVIYDIEKANNLVDAMIHPGDTLKVPSPSEKSR